MTHGLTGKRPGELPAEVTGFVGRQRELAVLDGLLGTARLVTVTGPGGVGKTRVALRAAARGRGRFADGVCLAELGGLHDPDLLPHTVATCLGLPEQDDRSQLGRDRGLPARPPAAAHPRLLRAPDRRVRGAGRAGAALRGAGDRAGHQPAADERAGRALLPGAAAAGPRTPEASRRPPAGPRRRGGAVRPAGRGGLARLRRHAGQPPRRDPAVPAPGRHPAGDRAGRRAAAHPDAAAAEQPAGASLRPAHRRPPRGPAAPADAARHHAMELRPLLARRSSCCGRGCRCSPGRSTSPPPRRSAPAGRWPARTSCPPWSAWWTSRWCCARRRTAARYWLLDTIREFGAERLAERPSRRGPPRRTGTSPTSAPWPATSAATTRTTTSSRATVGCAREHPDLRAALGYALDRPGRAREAARLAADLRAYWAISGLLREGKHWLTKILLRFPGPSAERAWLLMTRGVLAALQGELGQAVADLELSIADGAASTARSWPARSVTPT